MDFIKSNMLLLCCAFCLAQETGARYLIITHDDYYNAVLPLAEWKTQKGMEAKIVRISAIGSDSTSIKNYITYAYMNWPIKPEYLLLVGDKSQIPFPRRGGSEICYSDNYYTNIEGGFRNEIIPGRFWVSDSHEAMTVVSKVLGYEKEPYLVDSLWYRKGTTIINLTWDSLPGDSTYWESTRYVHGLMQNAGFIQIDEFVDVFGHTDLDVIDAINDGRSYITYRGDAGGRWGPPFWDIYPAQMDNGYMLPIVVSATCATVEGIGCEWLCAGTANEPKGIVGFFGTTTNRDFVSAQRGALMKGTLASVFLDSLSTLGRAAESGRMKYFEQFNDSLEYDSWTCLGDPEMTVWTTIPRIMEVTHDTALYAKLCTACVNVRYNSMPVESALVCIMAIQDTSAYVYGRTDDSGTVALIDTFSKSGDSVLVTVTGRNIRPYYEYIRVNHEAGPYVLLNSFVLSDSIGGNGDSLANLGEDIEIPVWLKNWGDTTAHTVSATIQKIYEDPFFSLSDTVKYFGDIPALDSVYSSDDGFNVLISPECPDTHQIELRLVITDASNTTWTSDLCFTTHVPILLLNDYYFPGYLKSTPAGDTNTLTVELKNCGSYQAENTTGIMFSTDSFFISIDTTSSFGTIAADSIGNNEADPFIIATDPQTPRCYPIDIALVIRSGLYADTFEFTIHVGVKDFIVWDPDINNTSGPLIKTRLDSLGYYGDYVTVFPTGMLYLYRSLFICCGVYPNNYVIVDTSRAAQDIEFYLVSQNGRVYLEGGDVWVGDPQANHGYNFCSLFGVTPVSNTIGLFPGVTGTSGTFTQDMLFDYQGETSMIDRIDSTVGSAVVFRNSNNSNGCGVAYDHKTVGVSFECGGLVDTLAPSTKSVLIDSVMNYFGIAPTGMQESKRCQVDSRPQLAIYPNPCRGSVKIIYDVSHFASEKVMLKIYDISGRLVRHFSLPVNNPIKSNCIYWDVKDCRQRRVTCGIYFVCLVTEDCSTVEKMVLLK